MSQTTEQTFLPSRRRFWTSVTACFILSQVLFLVYLNPTSTIQTSFSRLTPSSVLDTESEHDSSSTGTGRGTGAGAGAGYHPDVAKLSFKNLAELDKLSEYITQIEADRVFSKSRLGHIQGTRWRGGQGAQGQLAQETVRTIREQIHCWTQYGAWVRQDGIPQRREENGNGGNATEPWAARKHRGDARFGQCDVQLMKSLDKEAQKPERDQTLKGDFYLGDYDRTHDRWIVREAVKWRWIPDESICGPLKTGGGTAPESPTTTVPSTTPMGFKDDRAIYRPFEKKGFCESLQDRNILVVGDLTQYQLHDAILSATETDFSCHGEMGCLHRRPHPLCYQDENEDPALEYRDFAEIEDEFVKPPYLKYVRNDIISVPWAVDPELSETPSGATIEQPWATSEMFAEYKIVLLNRGLFWRTDDEFLMELVFTIKYIWKFYSGTMIIYRATHPVFNCTGLKEQNEDGAMAGSDGQTSIFEGTLLQQPLTVSPGSRQAPGSSSSSSSSSSTTESTTFRPTLADVQRQNRMAKAIVEAAGGIYLDTEDMFAKRPDGRMGNGDCARFCAPGPLDAYADLLYNMFRLLV
ncbi:hypothetical protein BGZ95_001288 [Linnemannia exigua]|uniref:Uncharacterized protein n=1 Tax=Linnemannia exigua TaxID=604196 RepID=A0AAD4DJ97_9FUNG|nr:hypothetical protein BGZ95_001288 [Linnemannia exigua]